MNWSSKTLEQIVGGKNLDGSSMLQSFLKDYAKLTSTLLSSLQPGCPSCLSKYYREYTLKTQIMSNECNYVLQKRYNGLPLAFGSKVLLNNTNLTDEYAEQLISRYLDIYESREDDFEPSLLFTKYPANWEDAQFEKEEVHVTSAGSQEQEPEDAELTLSQLRKKYPGIKAGSAKSFLEKLNK